MAASGRRRPPCSRVADGGHRLDVVPVAVGLEHRAHAEAAAEVEQALVLVGGVEQDGVPVSVQRSTKTLFSYGPTTTLWISARSSDQCSVSAPMAPVWPVSRPSCGP
jgi:hypothetical protein